jgi:hypothetical protein
MNGLSKKPGMGLGLEPLEIGTFFAGLVVVVGLYLESGPDWANALASHKWPARPIEGTALVALGVFAEVAIGIFIARSAKRAQLQAEHTIAELSLETERLRKEANDTALLLAYRSVGETRAFVKAMRPFGGTRYAIDLISESSNEIGSLLRELNMSLIKAGWIRGTFVVKTKPTLGFGVRVLTTAAKHGLATSEAANALADWLDNRQVAVISFATTSGLHTPGTVVLQIGTRPETLKQQEEIRAEYARVRALRPFTQPQA